MCSVFHSNRASMITPAESEDTSMVVALRGLCQLAVLWRSSKKLCRGAMTEAKNVVQRSQLNFLNRRVRSAEEIKRTSRWKQNRQFHLQPRCMMLVLGSAQSLWHVTASFCLTASGLRISFKSVGMMALEDHIPVLLPWRHSIWRLSRSKFLKVPLLMRKHEPNRFWSNTLLSKFSSSKVLDATGFLHPTPTQAQVWPIALSGRDVITIAKTGSGQSTPARATFWYLG